MVAMSAAETADEMAAQTVDVLVVEMARSQAATKAAMSDIWMADY